MSFELTEDKKEFARKIIEKALSNSSFKERLMEEPTSAIKEIHPDYNLADNTKLEVVDQTKFGTLYINVSALEYVLLGGEIEDIELTPEQLAAVAGGVSCYVLSCFDQGPKKESFQ
jgi:NifB/MoaA-like Fe-S oxidoreductase